MDARVGSELDSRRVLQSSGSETKHIGGCPSPTSKEWGARVCIAALGVLLGVPSMVYADGGASLIMARELHLVAGSALIGLAEGLLLGLLFRARFRRSIPIMILANYASTVVAEVILSVCGEGIFTSLLGAEPLYALPGVFRLLVVLAFVESLLVEWPFCLWVMKPGRHRLAKSVMACLVAQAVSYAALIPFYRFASDWSLYTEMTVDRSLVSESSEPTDVYFISPGGDALCRIGLNGTGLTNVCAVGERLRNSKPFFWRSDNSRGWNLSVGHYGDEGREKGQLILKDLPVRAGGWRWGSDDREERTGPWGTWNDTCNLQTARSPSWVIVPQRDWLAIERADTHQRIRIGLATPFLAWRVSHATMLPGDKVVCRFGDQILLLDLNRRRVGFIARGRSPIVAIPDGGAMTESGTSTRATTTTTSRQAKDGGVE